MYHEQKLGMLLDEKLRRDSGVVDPKEIFMNKEDFDTIEEYKAALAGMSPAMRRARDFAMMGMGARAASNSAFVGKRLKGKCIRS